MRWAKSYSIVDHRLLHGGYFQKLSHEALVLYLFLIVVGDKDGRSFYANRTIEGILHLSREALLDARQSLIRLHLINYQQPYWGVRNIQEPLHERSQTKDPILQRRPGALLSTDPRPIRDITKKGLQALFKHLEENDEKEIPA